MASRFEVDDALWAEIAPLMPVKQRRRRYPGRRPRDDRQALNGILYVLNTGIAWRDLGATYSSALAALGGVPGLYLRIERIGPLRAAASVRGLDAFVVTRQSPEAGSVVPAYGC